MKWVHPKRVTKTLTGVLVDFWISGFFGNCGKKLFSTDEGSRGKFEDDTLVGKRK